MGAQRDTGGTGRGRGRITPRRKPKVAHTPGPTRRTPPRYGPSKERATGAPSRPARPKVVHVKGKPGRTPRHGPSRARVRAQRRPARTIDGMLITGSRRTPGRVQMVLGRLERGERIRKSDVEAMQTFERGQRDVYLHGLDEIRGSLTRKDAARILEGDRQRGRDLLAKRYFDRKKKIPDVLRIAQPEDVSLIEEHREGRNLLERLGGKAFKDSPVSDTFRKVAPGLFDPKLTGPVSEFGGKGALGAALRTAQLGTGGGAAVARTGVGKALAKRAAKRADRAAALFRPARGARVPVRTRIRTRAQLERARLPSRVAIVSGGGSVGAGVATSAPVAIARPKETRGTERSFQRLALAPYHLGRATAVDPSGMSGATALGFQRMLVGLPAGLRALVEDPGAAIDAIKADYARRYGPLIEGDTAQFRRIAREEGLAPYALDILGVAAPPSRAFAVLARNGIFGPRLRRVFTAPRPGLRVAEGVTRPRQAPRGAIGAISGRQYENLSRALAGRRARKGTQRRLEAGPGEIVPLSAWRAGRLEVKALAGLAARSGLVSRREAFQVRGRIAKALRPLSKLQQRALKTGVELGIRTPAQAAEVIPARLGIIERDRAANPNRVIPEADDEVPVLNEILEKSDEIFTPEFGAAADLIRDLGIQTAALDPAFGKRAAFERRTVKQAEVLREIAPDRKVLMGGGTIYEAARARTLAQNPRLEQQGITRFEGLRRRMWQEQLDARSQAEAIAAEEAAEAARTTATARATAAATAPKAGPKHHPNDKLREDADKGLVADDGGVHTWNYHNTDTIHTSYVTENPEVGTGRGFRFYLDQEGGRKVTRGYAPVGSLPENAEWDLQQLERVGFTIDAEALRSSTFSSQVIDALDARIAGRPFEPKPLTRAPRSLDPNHPGAPPRHRGIHASLMHLAKRVLWPSRLAPEIAELLKRVEFGATHDALNEALTNATRGAPGVIDKQLAAEIVATRAAIVRESPGTSRPAWAMQSPGSGAPPMVATASLRSRVNRVIDTMRQRAEGPIGREAGLHGPRPAPTIHDQHAPPEPEGGWFHPDDDAPAVEATPDFEDFAPEVPDLAYRPPTQLSRTQQRLAAGLVSPGYWPSAFTTGRLGARRIWAREDFEAAPGVKQYTGTWFRAGAESSDPKVIEQALTGNVRRGYQWNLVDEILRRHAPEWGRNAPGQVLRGRIVERGLDPEDWIVVDPHRIRDLAGTVLPDEELRNAFRRALTPSEFDATRQSFLVPKLLTNELDKHVTSIGQVGAFFKTKVSRIILGGLNVPWIQFQVLSNLAMSGLAGAGPGELVRSYRWWKKLGRAERDSIDPFIGMGTFENDVSTPYLIAGEGGRLVGAWRAYKKSDLAVARYVRGANFLTRTFQVNHFQDLAFRRAVGHSWLKKQAYKRMGEQHGRLFATQQRVMDILTMRKPEEQMRALLKDKGVLEEMGRHIDTYLGDYLTFSAFERRWLASNVMWYAYLRFSTRLLFYTLPMKHPITLSVLGKLAQLGADENMRLFEGNEVGVLPFNLGKIYFQGGLSAIDLSRANPVLNSITQNAGLGGLASGILPPYVTLLIEQIAKQSIFTGKPWKIKSQTLEVQQEETVAWEERGRIVLREALSLFYPYRTAEDIMAGGQPLGADHLLFSPRTLTYERADVVRSIEDQKEIEERRSLLNKLAGELAPGFVPRPSVDKHMVERRAEAIRRINKARDKSGEAEPGPIPLGSSSSGAPGLGSSSSGAPGVGSE